MTTHTLTGTATDTMGAADTDTGTINSTASAPQRVVRRSFFIFVFNCGGEERLRTIPEITRIGTKRVLIRNYFV